MREEALYVLRLWCDGGKSRIWRASLMDLRTRQVYPFATVEALQAFIDDRTARVSPEGSEDPEKEERQ